MELQINPVLIACIRMSWDVQMPFLFEMSFDVSRCLVCRRLVFFRLAGPFITRCPGSPTVSVAFWSKFSPDDFNRDFAACLIFLPCTTSRALFNPVF